jgi:hypothetical protein
VFASTGSVTVVNCTFSSNLAINGPNGIGSFGLDNSTPGQGVGGAMFVASTNLLLLNNVFINNSGSSLAPEVGWPFLVDNDGDGLPDGWELAYFGDLNQSGSGDFDGDGQSNLFEYVAGLNPANSDSKFALCAQTVAGTNVSVLRFGPWAAGRTYTPHFTTNLAAPFALLTGYGGPTTNGTELTITDHNATNRQRFYRMQITLP